MMDGAQFAVSADGMQLVLAARRLDGHQRMWIRRLQSLDWHDLPGTDGAAFPFWSPDSRHVGFFANNSLKRIDVFTNLTQTICEAPSGRGGSWGIQDVIVFAGSSGLMTVPASGGTPQSTTKIDVSRGDIEDLWPQFVQDGRHFVFFKRTATTGAAFSASSTVLAYRRQKPTVRQLMWFDRNGRGLDAVGEPGDYESFGLSPDGTRVAVARRDAQSGVSSLWLMDPALDRINRLTVGPANIAFPVWSPDGFRIAFNSHLHSTASNRLNGDEVHAIAADGGGKEQVLFRSSESKHLTDWSRDGRFVFYTARSVKTGTDLWALPTMDDQKPQPIDQSPANQSQGVLSPDGRWIAYVSDESGTNEVYVRAFPPAEGMWQISTEGGAHPRWHPRGGELFFVSSDGRVMSVGIVRGPRLQYRAPRTLFVARGAENFAVGPDGQRFLVQLPVRERSDNELHVVLNWASEVPTARAPLGR